MAVTVPYTVCEYTIDSDGTFPNKAVDLPSFIDEIEASAIAKVLVAVIIVAGNCRITFATDLSQAEVDILDGLVLAHQALKVGEPHTLPFIWQVKNPVANQASVKMNVMGLANAIDGYVLMRPAMLVGAILRFKNALTTGTLTIHVSRNGTAVKSYVHTPAKGTRKLWNIIPGTVTYAKGDVAGFRYETSADMLPAADNEIDITMEMGWV